MPGGLSITNDTFVIVIVVALTFLMWLACARPSERTALESG